MLDLSNCNDLAIIGMEIASPENVDLHSYGFKVFRGLIDPSRPEAKPFSSSEISRLITKVIAHAGLNLASVGVLIWQKELLKKVKQSGITNPLMDITDLSGGMEAAWVSAADWVESGHIDAVLLVEEIMDSKSLALVLISTSKYASDNHKQPLAVLAGASVVHGQSLSEKSFIEAFQSGKVEPDQIGLVITSAPLNDAPEMRFPADLMKAFQSDQSSYCAVSGGEGGLLSIIKTVWCINKSVIPGTPDWTAPENPSLWAESAFYVPTESRTWFTSDKQPVRYAVTINASQAGFSSIFVFKDVQSKVYEDNNAMQYETFYMFPVIGSTPQDLLANLNILQNTLSGEKDLRILCEEHNQNWQAQSNKNDLVVCILGHSLDELLREIEFAVRGIPTAVEKNADWRTPIGSYFTPLPQGRNGSVSFVYPGAFNSYPGVSRDLFYLFPSLSDRLASISSNLSSLLNEKMLYPRSISVLSKSDLEDAEKRLALDPLAMLISGTSLAALYTFLLRETFEIHPASAIGYSLGEISMMFASGVWTQADETSAALRKSPLFRTRLAGSQNAVRENWDLPVPETINPDETIWENYVLMASPEVVTEAIKSEPRVYMTHINTPRQVVIAGDPDGCKRVIALLKCNSLQAPFNYALHCEAMQSEFEALQTLHTWPVTNLPGMTLYSAATYQPMPIETQAIARQIAYGLCHQLDFPRLINQAYADGARIFIELGAGANCSRWVDDSLKDKPHASFSINRKGIDDHTAIVQLMAKLISHQVSVNLSSLIA